MKNTIKTCLIPGHLIPSYDMGITRLLDCEYASLREVRNERFRIGICNYEGEIYRVIGTTRSDLFCKVIYDLEEEGFSDEQEEQAPRGNYDSVLVRYVTEHF